MKQLACLLVALISVAACQKNTETPSLETAQSFQQCGKDTDCKGERICDSGKCVNPAKPTLPESPHASLAVSDTPQKQPDQTYSPLYRPNELTLAGECHQGECPWTKILKVDRIQQSNSEITLKVSVSNGLSDWPDDSSKPPENTTWESPTTLLVTCSHTTPSILSKKNNFNEHLPLRPDTDQIGAPNIDSVNLYFAVCHSSSNSASTSSYGSNAINDQIRQFKYDVPELDSDDSGNLIPAKQN